ncbi:hypothetical protein [Streptomyces griseus]|uniref:hypothetical protein n=1 Tax=Streptomyces griseus TaxID=1911 RepID=UPI0036950276
MTRQLTTQNATITTATVEVKTLTIGSKQVSLTFFRQLKEQPLVSEDGTLNGEPWGTINYHPDKCGDAPEHLHVVWQEGQALRRSAVQLPHAGDHSHSLADLYVAARLIDGTVHAPHSYPEPGDVTLSGRVDGTWHYYASGHFILGTMSYRGKVSATQLKGWRLGLPVDAEYAEAFRDALMDLDLLPRRETGEMAPHLLDKIPARQYQETVDRLEKLPQLYIGG